VAMVGAGVSGTVGAGVAMVGAGVDVTVGDGVAMVGEGVLIGTLEVGAGAPHVVFATQQQSPLLSFLHSSPYGKSG
jgi:hypothetical protein